MGSAAQAEQDWYTEHGSLEQYAKSQSPGATVKAGSLGPGRSHLHTCSWS